MTPSPAIDDTAEPSRLRETALIARAELALAIVLAAVWLFLTASGPMYFVFNNETGHQLAGGWNLLHSDQWPQLDYVTSYGPGRYFVSALGLWLAHDGLFGELLTRSLCDVLYLVLLQRLLRRVGVTPGWSWLLFAAAMVALPPSHKYWTALCPILTLWAARLCMERSTGWRWSALGLALGFAGFFRADYGLFALAPALVLWLMLPARGERAHAAGCLVSGAALLLGPWSLLVQRHGGLMRLFTDWAQTGAATGAGLSMPHPLWHWQDPSLSFAFLAWVAVPLAGLWLTRRQQGAERAFAWAVYISALVNLVQSSHRADWSHFLQGIAPGFVAIALFLRDMSVFKSMPLRLAQAPVLGLLGACLILGGLAKPSSPDTALANWQAAALSKEAFRHRYLDGTAVGELVSIAMACVPPGSPTAFYPFTPQLHYFAGRPFAGELPYLAPGFFATDAQQDRAVRAMEAQRPAVLFWDEGYAYDAQPDRNAVVTHSRVHRYLDEHYERREEVAGFGVFTREGVQLASGCPLAQQRAPG